MSSDQVAEYVAVVNSSTPEGYGLDYKYNSNSGTHTLTPLNSPDAVVKTTVDQRAMLFVEFYDAGFKAGALSQKLGRIIESAETEKVDDPSKLRLLWNRLFNFRHWG